MQATNLDETTMWHVETELSREAVREPTSLLLAAQRLVKRLPKGRLCLLTRNEESAALVGALLALDPDRCTDLSWIPVTIGRYFSPPVRANMAFIEAGQIGAGLRALLGDRYPSVLIIDRLADVGESPHGAELRQAA
jgi:hypothetical protein